MKTIFLRISIDIIEYLSLYLRIVWYFIKLLTANPIWNWIVLTICTDMDSKQPQKTNTEQRSHSQLFPIHIKGKKKVYLSFTFPTKTISSGFTLTQFIKKPNYALIDACISVASTVFVKMYFMKVSCHKGF